MQFIIVNIGKVLWYMWNKSFWGMLFLENGHPVTGTLDIHHHGLFSYNRILRMFSFLLNIQSHSELGCHFLNFWDGTASIAANLFTSRIDVH